MSDQLLSPEGAVTLAYLAGSRGCAFVAGSCQWTQAYFEGDRSWLVVSSVAGIAIGAIGYAIGHNAGLWRMNGDCLMLCRYGGLDLGYWSIGLLLGSYLMSTGGTLLTQHLACHYDYFKSSDSKDGKEDKGSNDWGQKLVSLYAGLSVGYAVGNWAAFATWPSQGQG